MGKAIKFFVLICVISFISVSGRAYAQLFSDVIVDWSEYINPDGKYELSFKPTEDKPYYWDIEGIENYNAFSARRMLIGYRYDISSNAKAEVAIRIRELETELDELILDRAFVDLYKSTGFCYDFKLGYFQNPWLEWVRSNYWKWDMFEFPLMESLGLMPRSQMGINLGIGFRDKGYDVGIEGNIFNGGELEDESFEQYQARFRAKFLFENSSVGGVAQYLLNRKPEREGYQELWQYGLAFDISFLRIGGEYFEGKGWIPAGEAYILGRWPEGLSELLNMFGRSFTRGEEIDYYGWTVAVDFGFIKPFHLIYRYDLFDASRKFDDDQEYSDVIAAAYELSDNLYLGLGLNERYFQSTKIKISDIDLEMDPIRILMVGLEARIP